LPERLIAGPIRKLQAELVGKNVQATTEWMAITIWRRGVEAARWAHTLEAAHSKVNQSLSIISRRFALPSFHLTQSPDAAANSSDRNKLHSPWRPENGKKRENWTEEMNGVNETFADRFFDAKPKSRA
jgi:hypothetical protein